MCSKILLLARQYTLHCTHISLHSNHIALHIALLLLSITPTHLCDVDGALVCGGGALAELQLLQVDALNQFFPLLAPLPEKGLCVSEMKND